MTLAFPEDGAVTAKTIEVRDGNAVSCTGTTRDNASMQKMIGRLSAMPGVLELHQEQIRGKTPMQFTFEFHWGNGGGNAN